MREFELIDRLRRLLPTGTKAGQWPIEVPNGDDAAVVSLPSATRLVLTSDAVVEGRHFSRATFTPREVGWKAVAVNQSDIAAMGAEPRLALISLGVGAGTPADWEEQVYMGVADALREHGGLCVGGNVTGAPYFFISICMLGELPVRPQPITAMCRNQAKPGDTVVVSGPLGAAGAGLVLLKQGYSLGAEDPLRQAQCRPRPRVDIGFKLALAGVRAAIDISDGLTSDLGKLCTASGVGAKLLAHRVPVSQPVALQFPDNPLIHALNGGEDYELLFTCSAALFEQLKSQAWGRRLAEIGTITDTGRIEIVDQHGKPVPHVGGWEHEL